MAAQNNCSFDGRIQVHKDRVFEVAREVQLTKKFESVKNVTRNAVGKIKPGNEIQNVESQGAFSGNKIHKLKIKWEQ